MLEIYIYNKLCRACPVAVWIDACPVGLPTSCPGAVFLVVYSYDGVLPPIPTITSFHPMRVPLSILFFFFTTLKPRAE